MSPTGWAPHRVRSPRRCTQSGRPASCQPLIQVNAAALPAVHPAAVRRPWARPSVESDHIPPFSTAGSVVLLGGRNIQCRSRTGHGPARYGRRRFRPRDRHGLRPPPHAGHRVAATVTVIDQARIETTLATDIRELVRYEPGLSVRNDPFRFGLDTISIRGLGGNRVAVEVDGIPAAGGFAVGSYADSGRAFVDAAFVDRVEFLRGPASSLYGSDAIGGVVAMTTRSRKAAGAGRGRSCSSHRGGIRLRERWLARGGARGRCDWRAMAGRVFATRRPRIRHGGRRYAEPERLHHDSALLKITGAVPGGPLTFTAEAGRIQQATASMRSSGWVDS